MKFKTCLILISDIEHVVRNANNTWKNTFNPHQKSDFVFNVNEKEDDKEVKDSLKKNEVNLTVRFNTCLILINGIEHMVMNATNTWKRIFNLQKQRDFVVHASEKD